MQYSVKDNMSPTVRRTAAVEHMYFILQMSFKLYPHPPPKKIITLKSM